MSLLNKDELLALLPDNTSGAISPADVREIVQNVFNAYGGIGASGTAPSQSFDTTPSGLEQWDHSFPSQGVTPDPSGSLLTVNVSGVYAFHASMSWQGDGGNVFEAHLYHNEDPTVYGFHRKLATGDVGQAGFCGLITCASGDQLSIMVNSNKATPKEFDVEDAQFFIRRVG